MQCRALSSGAGCVVALLCSAFSFVNTRYHIYEVRTIIPGIRTSRTKKKAHPARLSSAQRNTHAAQRSPAQCTAVRCCASSFVPMHIKISMYVRACGIRPVFLEHGVLTRSICNLHLKKIFFGTICFALSASVAGARQAKRLVFDYTMFAVRSRDGVKAEGCYQ